MSPQGFIKAKVGGAGVRALKWNFPLAYAEALGSIPSSKKKGLGECGRGRVSVRMMQCEKTQLAVSGFGLNVKEVTLEKFRKDTHLDFSSVRHAGGL